MGVGMGVLVAVHCSRSHHVIVGSTVAVKLDIDLSITGGFPTDAVEGGEAGGRVVREGGILRHVRQLVVGRPGERGRAWALVLGERATGMEYQWRN